MTVHSGFDFRSLRVRRACRMPVVGLSILATMALVTPTPARADAKSALPPGAGALKMVHSPQSPFTYTPGTLENHIDGEAEAVKRYDFKECAYAEYAPNGQGNQLVTVDIYQMGDPTDAYGYYSSQRNPSARVVKIGAEGYQEPTALNFWKGPYYVKIAITANNPAAFQADMPRLAAAVATKLSGSTATPAIVNLLPPGFTPRTESYRRSDIAAQSYIRNGMVARYPSAGPQAELFVAVYPTPAAAKSAFQQYHTYLTKPSNMATGARPATIAGLGDAAVGVKSKFTGEVVAAVKGKYLVGIRRAKDQASAQALVKAAFARAH